MTKLVATKSKVGGHAHVFADPEDEYWRSKGYVPADEVEGETGEDEDEGGDEGEVDEGETGEDEELEVDLHAMTVPELSQFVKDYNLPVDLANHRLKDEKIKAIEEAIEEFGLDSGGEDEDEGDTDEDVAVEDKA